MASLDDILAQKACEIKAELIDASYDLDQPPVLMPSTSASGNHVEALNSAKTNVVESKPEVLDAVQLQADSENPDMLDTSDEEDSNSPPKIQDQFHQSSTIEPPASSLAEADAQDNEMMQMPGQIPDIMRSISQEFNFDELFPPEMMINIPEEYSPPQLLSNMSPERQVQIPSVMPSVTTPQNYNQPEVNVKFHYTREGRVVYNDESTSQCSSDDQMPLKPYSRVRRSRLLRKYPYFFKPLPSDEYEESTIEGIGYPICEKQLESDCPAPMIPQYSNFHIDPIVSPDLRDDTEYRFEESCQNAPSMFFVKNALKKFCINACGNDFSEYNYSRCDERESLPDEVIRVARGGFSGFAAISLLLTGDQRHWSKVKRVLTATVLKLRKQRRRGIRQIMKHSPDFSLFGPLNQAHLEAFAHLTEARVFVYGGKDWREMYGTEHQHCVSSYGNNDGFEVIDIPTFCLSIDELGDFNVVKSVK